MAGFEVVVRPVVFPNIRPAPARSLPIEDAPDKGFAVISGSGGERYRSAVQRSVAAGRRSRMVEIKRHFDKARIYYTQDGRHDSIRSSIGNLRC